MVTVTTAQLSVGGAYLTTRDPHDYCCAGCGYGIVVRSLPHECPMCRGTDWEQGHRKPELATTALATPSRFPEARRRPAA
jgi:hypothetical protein